MSHEAIADWLASLADELDMQLAECKDDVIFTSSFAKALSEQAKQFAEELEDCNG